MKAYYREKIRLLAEFGIPIAAQTKSKWITIAIAPWLDK